MFWYGILMWISFWEELHDFFCAIFFILLLTTIHIIKVRHKIKNSFIFHNTVIYIEYIIYLVIIVPSIPLLINRK